MKHRCDECGENEATVHYTQIGKDQEVREVHLCQACAEKQGEKAWVHISSLAELLSGLKETEVKDQKNGICPNCGLTFSQFKKGGKLGCAECYEAMAEQLEPIIVRMHGSSSHVGKKPTSRGEERPMVEQLMIYEKRLDEAIKREEYEEAANLRDAIKQLIQSSSGGERERQ